MTSLSTKALFGEDAGWNADEWTSSDDRVRGGKSQSRLIIASSGLHAVFEGSLDITALGGAGFASQRTTAIDRSWDLSAYQGITLTILEGDPKRYTFILKDEILPPRADGREQSTISYEYDFKIAQTNVSNNATDIFIPWNELKATYRGKEKSDAPKLKLNDIRRFSIMMRSFFGTQEGDFTLTIKSIVASNIETESPSSESPSSQGLLSWLANKVWKL